MKNLTVPVPLTSVNSIMQDYYGSHEPSKKWSTDFIFRVVHATLQIITFAAGLTSGVCLGWVSSDFKHCLLYTSMKLSKDENGTLSVDTDATDWMSKDTCSFVTYTGVCAAIYALIWCWFYLLMSDWGSRLKVTGRPPDLSLLAASIVISVIFLCLSVAAAGMVTKGFQYWCNTVEESLKTIFKDPVQCSDLSHYPWMNPPRGSRSYPYLEATEIGVWVMTVSFALQTVIAGVRVKMYSSIYNWYTGSKQNTGTNVSPADINYHDIKSNESMDRTSSVSDYVTPSTTAVEVYKPTSTEV